MNQYPLAHFFASDASPLKLGELIDLISEPGLHYLFIKDQHLRYAYANQHFVHLMGLKTVAQLVGLEDKALYDDKALIHRYTDYDKAVLETETSLNIADEVRPKFNENFAHVMEGKEYPLYVNSDKPNFVLGIVSPKAKLLKLDWNSIFNLENAQIESLLVKKFYIIKTAFGKVRFSKREIQVLIQLLKGYHAGQAAENLQLKQTTIESYLSNIKNKTGVCGKAELIHFVIANNLLEQIIL